jgi:hypothetical protein
MRKDQVTIGGVYVAKISDKLTRVRIDGASPHGGWDATNLTTNKKARIKSPAKLRGPAAAKGEAKAETPAAATPQPTHAKAKKAPAAPKAKKVSGLDAAFQVLKDAGKPMQCRAIVETMLSKGLWKTGGKTPAATIYSAILREISTKGNASRFRKTERGHFVSNGK